MAAANLNKTMIGRLLKKRFSLPLVKANLKAALPLKSEMDNRIDLTHKLEMRVQEKTIALQRAHDELLASDARYRGIYETAIEGIFETTAKGRWLSASPSLARILGYESPLELVTTISNVTQLYVNAKDRKILRQQLDKTGEIYNFETRFRTKHGAIIWVMICAKAVRNETKGQTCFQGFLIDITEQKASQLKSLQHMRELRLLNKVIAASVKESRIESILDIACREISNAFNLPHSAAVLLDDERTRAEIVAEYIHVETGSKADPRSLLNQSVVLDEQPLLAQLATSTSPTHIINVRGDGRIAPLADVLSNRNIRSLLLAPILIEDKAMGCLALGSHAINHFSDNKIRLVRSVADQVAGVFSRIKLDKDRRQLQKQYFQAQKMEAIGQLTGGVAHDFNNILTVILAVSDMLRKQEDPQDPKQAKLQQIYDSAQKAADLVSQLMAFSRQHILNPIPLNFNTILNQYEQMLKRIIGEDIEIVTMLEPDLGMVKVDQGRMEQVLMNLIVNARDAMPRGGRLTIETANVVLDEKYAHYHLDVQPGAYVMVAVSDNGVGIEKSQLSQIFEPFYTTKGKGEGTGLGLATVHGIIKQSDGHIWVYSEPDHGTSFKIYLPRYEANQAEGHAVRKVAVGEKVVGGSETILLLEDDEALREIVFNTLTGFGYKVCTADRASTAAELFSSSVNEVDLMLTDVVLPGEENGVSLANRLCEKQPSLKVIYMSGYTDNAIIHHGVLVPEENFIQKPFMPEALARKVRQTLDDAP